jgi:hypothetical protein
MEKVNPGPCGGCQNLFRHDKAPWWEPMVDQVPGAVLAVWRRTRWALALGAAGTVLYMVFQ